MKKVISLLLITVMVFACCFAMAGCGGSDEGEASGGTITIAVPNDTTNEARALLLLQDMGYITLDPDAGITATIADITDNPYGIEIKEVEAAQVPNVLQDMDFGIINANYALEAGIDPSADALQLEGSSSPYGNILVVKEGNENEDWVKALAAALHMMTIRPKTP